MTGVGGWNRRIPPSVARCACPARQAWWARLNFENAGAPCCGAPCCRMAQAVIVSTREEITRLRAQCLHGDWRCPRCGEPVAAHQRNFECVDAHTRRFRELRVLRQSRRARW